MNPYYQDDRATVLHGDCLALMAEMPDANDPYLYGLHRITPRVAGIVFRKLHSYIFSHQGRRLWTVGPERTTKKILALMSPAR